MTETPRRRRSDRWAAVLLPLAVALILGSYGYTYRETGGIQGRLARIEERITRIYCRLDPEACLREGQP